MRSHCMLFLLAWLAGSGLGAQCQGQPEPPTLVGSTSFQRPVLGSESRKIAKLDLAVGQMVIRLTGGDALPILIGGKQVGFFYRGKGTMSFTTKDLSLVPTMKYNLSHGGRTRAEELVQATHLKDGIKEVTVWTRNHPVDLGEVPGESSRSSLAFDYKFHEEAIFDKAANSIPQSLVAHDLNDPVTPMVVASVRGQNDFWFYKLDQGAIPNEQLLLVNKGLIPLAKHAIGWDIREPIIQPFVLTKVELKLELEKNLRGMLTAVETFVPSKDGLRALELNLYSEDVFRLHREGSYRLRSVTDGKGRKLAFDHHSADLLVVLSEPTKAQQPIQLTFEIENPFIEEYDRAQYWEFSIEPWFPQPAMGAQSYTVHATMKIPDKYTPLMAGTTIRRVTENNFNILEIKIDQPVRFFTMQAGIYNLMEKKDGDFLIRVASSKTMGGQEGRLANIALQVIKGYETFLGPFPFKEFNIIQRPEWGYGQAPPGLMLITSEAFNSLGDELTKAYSKGVNQRVAHEIAHQYWGIVVKEPSEEEQWISEAFSEYCSAIMILRTKGLGQSAFDSLMDTWYRSGKEAAPTSSIALANNLRDPSLAINSRVARQSLIYFKGAYVLHALRQEIGDKAFGVFLKGVQDSFRWKLVCTYDLIDILKIITQKDFKDFFEKYYWGVEMPPRKP